MLAPDLHLSFSTHNISEVQQINQHVEDISFGSRELEQVTSELDAHASPEGYTKRNHSRPGAR